QDQYRGSSTLVISQANISDCVTDLETRHEVIYGLDGDATNPTNIQLLHGIAAYVWEDNRGVGFGKQIYYQVVDTPYVFPFAGTIPPNGSPAAPDNDGLSRYFQENPQVCTDGDNGFFVSFTDNRAGTKQIRVQRVGFGGALLCDDAGALVSASGNDQDKALVVPDGQGGCYVVWSGFDAGFILEVYAMRMGPNCEQLWAVPVVLSDNVDDDDQLHSAIADENGCLVAVWQTGTFGTYDVIGAKVCSDGTIAWRHPVCAAPNEQGESQVINDGQGGYYFAWADNRDQLQLRDVYAQHFTSEGTLAPGWTSALGRLVASAPNDQKKPRLAVDGSHNLYVIWEDFRSGTQLDIYGQKLSPTGGRLWVDDVSGRPLATTTTDQQDVRLLVEWHNGLYGVWVDQTSSFSDIYGVHIDSMGNISDTWWGPLQDPSGGVVNNEYQNQTSPCITHDHHGGTMVGWVDWRSSGKEPLQNIWGNWINDFTVNVRELPAPLPRNYTLTQNYPNPFNPTTQFRFTIPATEAVKITVFNALGQQVQTLLDEVKRAGTYEVQFDASELSSGVYFYRLSTPTFETVKKMQLIK
ncbi:MAG: T9SS type A sorting domain-containing protein, partial [Calditrichaeota bacterium]|nr:T9SS type A sorting domain-containing protein [Calditrichota bacterium]